MRLSFSHFLDAKSLRKQLRHSISPSVNDRIFGKRLNLYFVRQLKLRSRNIELGSLTGVAPPWKINSDAFKLIAPDRSQFDANENK